ncbi:sigma-54-dependent Fis family transcriptional regulator [Pelosinus sp. UFO1]|uniref:sigma-54-dependent Fis family transcriptional regulator n=1 Tax=Pelosinus sp. UFO1 TaxID=484770 RepID=UPI0004D11C56|nr:sigma-54-dependent Fis family transcriptional regulator [Pelosinus sp. UFO1]AIF53341.1 sigma54 specific transcriptional regulator with PAS/PAC sensor, Fis family [Pelosinus sp. UFO1]
MTINNSYQDYTLPDWKKFIMGEKGQYSTRSLIIESWTRCYKASVNPYGNIIHSKLEEAAMFSMLLEKRELIEIAKPFMMNLYSFVEGSGFVVALTDERGYIMEMFGDEDTLNNPMTSNFFQGALWSEREGTNAIGTALMIKEAVQVSGAEHYCQKHHCLTCSAAPIFNPTGQVIGILDMSGASYTSHLHTLGMVAAAAEAITAQLAIQRKNRELAEANKRLTNLFNTMSDGVLMVDECGIIKQINPAAKDILSTIEHEIVGMPMDRLFGNKNVIAQLMLHSKESYEEIECIVDTKNSMFHCLASGEPLLDEQGRVIGGVILLRPKPTQNLENRFSGYQVTLQFGDVIGESAAIVEAIRVASLAAPTASTILLQGESGTGKEIFAQAIHNRSKQRNGPFVAMNCGVIPKDLIGSELFGYAEGAFTGAKRGGKPGKFEFASGGTLFLDEIGDMPLEQQIALLRVLQEKNITRIGSDKMIPINTRIICATNKNLMEEVKKGTFRQDLYYRLNVITVNIPPLRERKVDIPLLFTNFLERIGRERNCKFCVDPQVIECLQQFDWPGNVRELQNVVERAVSLSGTEMITAVHLPIEICAGINPPVALETIFSQALKGNFGRIERKKILENAEKQQIILFLTKHGGNVSEVARELKISRNTLYRKMHLYGVEN